MRRKFTRQRVPGAGGVAVRASNGIASSAAQPVGVRRAWLTQPVHVPREILPPTARRAAQDQIAHRAQRVDLDLEITLQVAHRDR